MDATVPKEAGGRRTNIVELPRLLRDYDSEYHYLADHLFRFSKLGDDYEYAYMMPNVLRRVLETFLAFRCPGTADIRSKFEQLGKAHQGLDVDRLMALERLVQVESHSDSLEDLLSFSSMTLEEAEAAADSVLDLMEQVDKPHWMRCGAYAADGVELRGLSPR